MRVLPGRRPHRDPGPRLDASRPRGVQAGHAGVSTSSPAARKKLAEKLLKPGTTFYEVEVTEPGKDSGTKYHMFFWDGAQWRMMGPAWRVLRPE